MTKTKNRRDGRRAVNRAPDRASTGANEPRAAESRGGAVKIFRPPSPELAILYGYHTVREALAVGRRKALTLFATAAAADRLRPLIDSSGVGVTICENRDLDQRLGADAVHQGVLLEARHPPALDLQDLERRSGIVLALDQITDPHNVGAIVRTAAAFGVDGLILTARHAPALSGALAKAACGGLEHIQIIEVVNLAQSLAELGELGYWRVGLDSEASAQLVDFREHRPLALVLGAEGAGLRRLTRERCDAMARLNTRGPIKSLNVSNACASALTTLAQA